MKPDRRINAWMGGGQPDGRKTRLKVQSRNENSRHPGFNGTLNDSVAVLVKFVEIQVAVCVSEHNQTLIVKIITYKPNYNIPQLTYLFSVLPPNKKSLPCWQGFG